MITGLKRSMPCEDLLSLGPAAAEKAFLEADKLLEDSVRSLVSSSKRRRTNRGSTKDHTDGYLERSDSPATAALEALSFDEDYEVDFLFDPVKISLVQTTTTTTTDFFFPVGGGTSSSTSFTCKASRDNISSLPSVHTVNEMTRALAYLSTTPTKA